VNYNFLNRKYTPISLIHQKGEVVFPIKIYRKNTHPSFPEGGMMSQYLDTLEIGKTVKMTGPKGKLEYLGHQTFIINGQEGIITIGYL
jgi:NADPH-dependent ferric siderophore reductase